MLNARQNKNRHNKHIPRPTKSNLTTIPINPDRLQPGHKNKTAPWQHNPVNALIIILTGIQKNKRCRLTKVIIRQHPHNNLNKTKLAEFDNIKVIQKLGFSKCKVSVAVPKTFEYNSIKDLEGMRIATSYPNTVIEYFGSFGMTVDIHQISGSVEIAPNIGLADGIVDIVSSGSTLFKNNLKEVK